MYLPSGISEDEYRDQELLLREREVRAIERRNTWEALEGIAIGVIPILFVLGIIKRY
jgi:hypothetical protein